jgi:hypothetical protein
MMDGLAIVRGCWIFARCSALFLIAFAGRQASSQTLTPIYTTGPTSNRINIVVLSEGYQSSELGQFLQDATNVVNSMMASPPYQEYTNYFNAFAISVASAQSGSDHHTPTPTLVDTYFNSTYDSFGIQRLITIPPNDWDGNYDDGLGKVYALLQSLMPEYDIAMLVVNDPQYGGSGGSVFISSVNSSSPEIVVHESGHAFGGLADEYSDAYPGWIPVEYPNATSQTDPALIKWTSWILGTTPIPTPASPPYTSLVGLFQGAEYQINGWYRPQYDCKMNHLGVPFCDICAEQLVKSIYQTVHSIDSFIPASTNISVTSTQPISFSVAPLQPSTHNLSIQWQTNGIEASGATNASFTVLPQFLNNGANFVIAEVRDATELVRTDPSNVLSNSVTWQLNVSLSQLQLVDAKWGSDGSLAFGVTGLAPDGFVIQASTDFSNWVPVSTNDLVNGLFSYTNSGADAFPGRFYRAEIKP